MVKVKSHEDNSIETECGKTRTIYLLFVLVAPCMSDKEMASLMIH